MSPMIANAIPYVLTGIFGMIALSAIMSLIDYLKGHRPS